MQALRILCAALLSLNVVTQPAHAQAGRDSFASSREYAADPAKDHYLSRLAKQLSGLWNHQGQPKLPPVFVRLDAGSRDLCTFSDAPARAREQAKQLILSALAKTAPPPTNRFYVLFEFQPSKSLVEATGPGDQHQSAAQSRPQSAHSTPSQSHPGTAGVNTAKGAQADVDFGAYMADLQRRIKRNWHPAESGEFHRVVIDFTIHASGEVSDLRIHNGTSGTADQNAAVKALKAVQDSNPFQALPSGAPESVSFQFTLDHSVFDEEGTYTVPVFNHGEVSQGDVTLAGFDCPWVKELHPAKRTSGTLLHGRN